MEKYHATENYLLQDSNKFLESNLETLTDNKKTWHALYFSVSVRLSALSVSLSLSVSLYIFLPVGRPITNSFVMSLKIKNVFDSQP